MAQTTGTEFERRVAEAIKQLDYKVIPDPLLRPGHGTWQDRVSSWLLKPSSAIPRPDLMVANGDKVVLVEIKAYPILLGPVIQARHYADYFEAPVIICVPDDAFMEIPESVRDWAEANDIVVSPIKDIADKLRQLL